MRGNGRVKRDNSRAKFLGKLRTHVAVQRLVQRPHLHPEPLEFRRQRPGRQFVARPPQRPQIVKAQFARAGVRQLDEPLVERPDRQCRLAPAQPHVQQFVGVAHGCKPPLHRGQVEALVAARRAVFAAAVDRLHLGDDAGELALQVRIGWGDGRQRRFEQVQFACKIRREVERIEARSLGDQFRRRSHQPGARGGRQRVRIVGDVRAAHPVCTAGGSPVLQQPGFGRGKKCLCFGHRLCVIGRCATGQRSSEQQRGEYPTHHAPDYSGGPVANRLANADCSRMMVSLRSEPVETTATVWPVTSSSRAT